MTTPAKIKKKTPRASKFNRGDVKGSRINMI